MAHTFLLEIGLEEIPAHVVTPSVEQLVTKVKNFLKEERLEFEAVKAYSTPRRLAVKVLGLADKQADIKEEAKGPAKKIALDADGNWTKAAQGSVRGQGMTTDDIFFKEIKGVEYVHVEKFIAGKQAAEILPKLKEVAMSLKFPTMMRWGSNDFEYVRPIKWLVALLDQEVVPFAILDVKTDRLSQGHRFLGKPVSFASADDYPEALAKEMVIADAAERKDMIRNQIATLARENDWVVDVDEDLLEEVNNLVEYPTVFAGKFADKYLEVPDVVLITSMKDNQRYFYVRNQAGKLLPFFIAVRNGNKAYLENVVAGNEKVLTARLEDAKFFYQEDQKQTIAQYVERLKTVMFHDKIGTIYQKMQRVQLLAANLGQKLGFTEEQLADLKRAAMIYKFDLVTGMVGEFSELQGIMGEIYARMQGEKETVAKAMSEEYMPTSAEGKLPASPVGALLSIADKLDSIYAFFAAGMIPSGSNDPYALRRQALGIVRIALDQNWNLAVTDLSQAIKAAYKADASLFEKIVPTDSQAEMESFILDRLHQVLAADKYSHDTLDTVVAVKANSFVTSQKAAAVLTKHRADTDFKETIEALTRVVRLAKKAPDFAADAKVDASLFENESEVALQAAVAQVKEQFSADVAADYELLRKLRQPISTYFDQTMVMAKDEAIKNNRLLQLSQLADLTTIFGQLDKLNVK